MQRTSLLRVIGGVVVAVVALMLVAMTRLHSQPDAGPAGGAVKPSPSSRQPQAAQTSPWASVPALWPGREAPPGGVAVAVNDLATLSLEQPPAAAATDADSKSGEDSADAEDKADADAAEADAGDSGGGGGGSVASKEALSLPLLNQELPGYVGGAGLLPNTRWRPTFDYHPHGNVHETMLFLQQYYARIRGTLNASLPSPPATAPPATPPAAPPRSPQPQQSPKATPPAQRLMSAASPPSSSVATATWQRDAAAAATVAAGSFPIYEDYSDAALQQLVGCANQTTCTPPALQLRRSFRVYFCRHVANGVRFYYLVREGLLLHPRVTLVDDIFAADVVVYLPESARWHRSECRDPRVRHRVVVLDEGDGPQLFAPPVADDAKHLADLVAAGVVPPPGSPAATQPPLPAGDFLLYFKRSYVRRDNGVFGGYMPYVARHPHVLPLFYPLATAYLRHPVRPHAERDLEIVCSLRGSAWDPTRQRVKEWTDDYVRARHLPRSAVRVGEVNAESRTTVSRGYFAAMYAARIVVTSNPSHWEGDFRLMEALASAALVFVDELFVPRPSMPLHGLHLVYYDNRDKAAFFDLLDAARAGFQRHPAPAAIAAIAGAGDATTQPTLRHIATTAVAPTPLAAPPAASAPAATHLRGASDAATQRRRLSGGVNATTTTAAAARRLAASAAALSPSERIAYRGYAHALRFLRTDALVDYVLRTLHIFELEQRVARPPPPPPSQTTTTTPTTPPPVAGSTAAAAESPPRRPRSAPVAETAAADAAVDAPPAPKKRKRRSGGGGGGGRRGGKVDALREFGFEVQAADARRLDAAPAAAAVDGDATLDAIGRVPLAARNFRVSRDRSLGSGPLHGYNGEHGFAMRWRAIPLNGNPSKATGVVAPGSARGTAAVLAASAAVGAAR